MNFYLKFVMLLVFTILFGILSCDLSTGNTQWINLFNQKDLTGWTELEGSTKYEAKNDQIIGTTIPNNPVSFLCTDKEFSNFILELDVKVDSPLNSGIQIRSHLNDKGEVYGYEIEIDPSKRAWSGGIYDCRRRGWIVDLEDKPEKQKAYKNGEWNHFKIKANGDTIKSWLNKIPIATLVDTLHDPTGFIGFEADGNKQAGLKIKFKNVYIKTL